VLLAASALLAVPTATPAAADEVSRARATVDRVQQLAEQATAELLEGTRRWEADQARLSQVRREAGNARRHVARSERQLEALQDQVAGLARQLSMRPAPSWVELAVTRGPEELVDALQLQGALDRAAGSQAEMVRRAELARLQLRREEVRVRQLEQEASRLVARSAASMRDLQALAARTARDLDAAQSALGKARERREARERAARMRALAAASGGATCTGASTAGQSNGNLDPGSLCPLWGAPGHRLRSDAAKAFNAMSRFHAATRGGPLCVTDSYRSYSEQVDVYRRKPGLAAVPGTSEHGWGKAVDLCDGVQDFDSPAHQWMRENAPRFGWFHPDWARRGGSRPEAWHWEFSG
jgi:D-alanyl-D-alanine dipeptidase